VFWFDKDPAEERLEEAQIGRSEERVGWWKWVHRPPKRASEKRKGKTGSQTRKSQGSLSLEGGRRGVRREGKVHKRKKKLQKNLKKERRKLIGSR